MPRFFASSTANLARSSCSGERYLGFRRLPHPMFTTYTPSARAWSSSETILVRVISPPFVNQRMAPYSRGGVLKFAAASRTGGTVICCQGLCAGKVTENSKGIANLSATFINRPPSKCGRVTNPPQDAILPRIAAEPQTVLAFLRRCTLLDVQIRNGGPKEKRHATVYRKIRERDPRCAVRL